MAIRKKEGTNDYGYPITKYVNGFGETIAKVVNTAMPIPIIPKRLPLLEVSGCDNPFNDKINKTAEIRYKKEE